jgi:methylmalonyl-CoA/ethylmalonyl-CoA epimerase
MQKNTFISKGNPEELILPAPSHMGFVTKNLKKSIDNINKFCGLSEFTLFSPDYTNKRYYGEPEDFKFDLALCRVDGFLYELIQVVDGRTIYEDFIKVHGEVMHHLGYEIDHLDHWIEAYKRKNLFPIMSGERKGLKWAYFDVDTIIIELLERTTEGLIV